MTVCSVTSIAPSLSNSRRQDIPAECSRTNSPPILLRMNTPKHVRTNPLLLLRAQTISDFFINRVNQKRLTASLEVSFSHTPMCSVLCIQTPWIGHFTISNNYWFSKHIPDGDKGFKRKRLCSMAPQFMGDVSGRWRQRGGRRGEDREKLGGRAGVRFPALEELSLQARCRSCTGMFYTSLLVKYLNANTKFISSGTSLGGFTELQRSLQPMRS